MANWIETITIILGTASLMGAMFKFMWDRLDKKFEAIDKRFEAIDKRFEAIDRKFEAIDKKFEKIFEELIEIRKDIKSIDVRLSRLEGQDEEKFRNEIRMIAGGKSAQ